MALVVVAGAVVVQFVVVVVVDIGCGGGGGDGRVVRFETVSTVDRQRFVNVYRRR